MLDLKVALIPSR